MTPNDCLVFLVTFCVLIAEGFYATGNIISEPVETALFVRSKRDDGRAMTFSGVFPYGGMTTYASGGDWGNWYRGHPMRKPVVSGWNRPQQPTETEELASPEATETSWKDDPQNTQEENKEEGNKEEAVNPVVNKKPKKKPTHHKEKSSEEEEDDTPVRNRNSGGNAAASFNAWFPIMLGMFPQEDGVNGYSSSRKSPPQTTIVANSVSHGPGGVASSHAVAYGGLPEQFYRSRH